MASQSVRTRKQTRLILLTGVALLSLFLAAGLAAAAPDSPGRMSLNQKATPTPATPPTTVPQPTAEPTTGTVSGGVFGGLPIGNNGNSGGVSLGNGGQEGGQSSGVASQFAFTCGNATVEAAVLVTFRDVRPGFTYQVTVVGLDSFDPVIGLQAADGSNLCNDDEPAVVGSQVDVPGVGLVTANNLSSQVRFTTSGSTGDIQMLIGGYGGQGGRYAAVFEGLAIAPASETDEVTINVAPEIQNDDLLVYMVSQTNDLDPYMSLLGSGMVCDDAGTAPCDTTPAFSGGGVAIANGGAYIAGQFDAGLGVVPGGSGDLTFQFGSYNNQSAGNYAMIVIGSAPGASTGGQSSGGQTTGLPSTSTISYGQTVSGVIDNTNYAALYAFQGNAGDTVSVRMEAAAGGDLDPYLGLMDANQNVLIEDDDGAGGLNSLFTTTLPSTGTYTIVATRYGIDEGTTSGAYTLSLTSGLGGTSGGQTPSTGDVQIMGGSVDASWDAAPVISVGMAVGNTITNADWGWGYAFDARAGQTVTIRMETTSGALDCYLGLGNPDQDLVAEDDDGGGGTNSQIVYTFPSAGRYYIIATRYGTETGTSTGSFVLTITEGTAAGTTTVSNNTGTTTSAGGLDFSQAPTFGSVELVSGFSNDPYTEILLAGGNVDASAAVGGGCLGYVASAPDYRLMYTAGQYNLRMFFEGEGDTTLVVNAPDGSWYCDDDSGGNYNPLIDFSAPPLSGQYDIWVGVYEDGQFVNGTLTITEMDIMPGGSSKAAFSLLENWKQPKAISTPESAGAIHADRPCFCWGGVVW